jgi:hypothetical protein
MSRRELLGTSAEIGVGLKDDPIYFKEVSEYKGVKLAEEI